ncbi:MAG: hypothetical protein M1826_005593 [Phylliscum demangeonii]|nr:MAG: hypothetical protein M1826_005593 [Phylliscum demangeonii]
MDVPAMDHVSITFPTEHRGQIGDAHPFDPISVPTNEERQRLQDRLPAHDDWDATRHDPGKIQSLTEWMMEVLVELTPQASGSGHASRIFGRFDGPDDECRSER